MGTCMTLLLPKRMISECIVPDIPRTSSKTSSSPASQQQQQQQQLQQQQQQQRQIGGELANFKLRKRRPGKSGLFWRSDPTGKTQLLINSDWPRDGAIIRGETFLVEISGEKWLKAHKVKQLGQQRWVDAPEGAFLPFEYDNHYYLEAVFA